MAPWLPALLLVAGPAWGQVTELDTCMQDLAGFALNCTANDVQVASATNIQILDDGCAYPGDDVTFAATFEVVLTAQERHDVGLYFAVDGDTNLDGAISGSCSVSSMAYTPPPAWLDLDGTADGGLCSGDGLTRCESDRDCRGAGGSCAFTQDLCGDIDAAHSPLYPVIEITTTCIDPDGNGKLNLPNCTSWRQPGANELCLVPQDAVPGAPSKCRCDLGFEVDIDVPPATLVVQKTADPSSLDEPGGVVRFGVSVQNGSPFAQLSLESLIDDVYGDITQAQHDILSTTCSLPQTQGPGELYSCSFEARVVGDGGTAHTDTVTATGIDENENIITGSDDATVMLDDLMPSISVVKTASPGELLEPGGDVTFTVRVNNTSAVDTVTIDSLVDSIHGNLGGLGSCSVPQAITPGGYYECAFTVLVSGSPGEVETDVVQARGEDEEGNRVTASDSATVNINDVASSIELTKLASPTSANEPGADVTFSFTIDNRSSIDTVTIDSLTDTIYGNLDGLGSCSTPQVLAPLGRYACSFTTFVAGDAGESETNVATASGHDDDGNQVSDDDDATVSFRDVAPSATLSKTIEQVVGTFVVEVRNDSAAEALLIESLDDDVFGDITRVQREVLATTCSVPRTLAPKGQAGDRYSCSFDGLVSASPHRDTVTGTLSDDEGNAITRSDDASLSF